MQLPSNPPLSDWVTIVLSIGGAIAVSIGAWYSLKSKVALNEQRLERAEKEISAFYQVGIKMGTINMRTRLTLQRVEHIEEMLSGRRVDRRKTEEENNGDENDKD